MVNFTITINFAPRINISNLLFIIGIGYTIWRNPKQQIVENGLEQNKEYKIFNSILHGTISERISVSFNFFARFPLEMFYIIAYHPIGLL